MKNWTARRLPDAAPFPTIVAIAIAAISFLPQFHWGVIGHHDNHRIVQVLIALIGGAVIVHQLFRPATATRMVSKTALYLLITFFSLGLLSAVHAWSVWHAMFEWANFALLVALAWLLAKKISTAKNDLLGQILIICGLGCAIYVFSWSVVYISWLTTGTQPDIFDLIAGFDNYRFFNHIQTVTLPLLALLVVRSRQRVKALLPAHPHTLMSLAQRHEARFWWLVLLFWWTLFFVTAGRGTFLGMTAGCVMALVWRGRHAFAWCRVMASTFVAGLVAYPVLYILIPMLTGAKPLGLLQEVTTRTVTNPTSDRWALWDRAIQMIIEHPLLGAGPLHFAHYGRDIMNGAHPHNWVLQIGSEWGVPALLCLAAVLAIALRALVRTGRAIKADDAVNQAILAAWLATFVAIVVDGLVSGLLVMPSSQLWIALYAGCAWGWTASFSIATNNPAPVRTRLSRRLAAMLGIVVLMFMVGRGLWPEINDLPAHEEKIVNETLKFGSNRLFPRIWRAGYF
ncbi:MAG: Pilin glycosylation enzyme [Burkholderia sp.]|nr:Pilin glycosylation enzyme [Burkholderia sp.]